MAKRSDGEIRNLYVLSLIIAESVYWRHYKLRTRKTQLVGPGK